MLIAVGIAFSPRVQFDSDLQNLDYDNEALRESSQLYDRKNADGFTHMYFAAWDENSLDEALEYNKGLFKHLDSLQNAGMIKNYSPLTQLLFQSQGDQETRIAAWRKFWNRGRVGQLRRDLAASAREYQGRPLPLRCHSARSPVQLCRAAGKRPLYGLHRRFL